MQAHYTIIVLLSDHQIIAEKLFHIEQKNGQLVPRRIGALSTPFRHATRCNVTRTPHHFGQLQFGAKMGQVIGQGAYKRIASTLGSNL